MACSIQASDKKLAREKLPSISGNLRIYVFAPYTCLIAGKAKTLMFLTIVYTMRVDDYEFC
jgi:hypothetical protein